MKLIMVVVVAALVVFVGVAPAIWAQQKASVQRYAGIVETDKGEGVYTLTEATTSFPGNTDAWGGAIAEFKRRHRDLEVISAVDSKRYSYGNHVRGYIILTVPKSKKCN